MARLSTPYVMPVMVILGISRLISSLTLDSSTLRQVNIIVRHGARSPTQPLPRDTHSTDWPQGYGQLTRVGVQEMAQLGSYLKEQYSGFLNDTYINDEIYVRSSNWDRTIMSAESLLAGLYRPVTSQDWPGTGLGWQPIPVHTVSPAEDILLDMDNPSCPPYDEAKIATYRTEEFQRKNASYEKYYQRLKDLTGITYDMSPYGVWNVYDTIYAEETEYLSVPAWFSPRDRQLMTQVFIPWQYSIHFEGLYKGRLKGGPLITQIVKNMQAEVGGSLSPARRKTFFYIGHDNNIVTSLMATGTYNWHYVPYATYLALELHHAGGHPYVRMLLQNSTTQQQPPIILNITVCGGQDACLLLDFTAALRPYFISGAEWRHLCLLPRFSWLALMGTVVLAVGGAVLLCTLLAAALPMVGSWRSVQRAALPGSEATRLLGSEKMRRPSYTQLRQ